MARSTGFQGGRMTEMPDVTVPNVNKSDNVSVSGDSTTRIAIDAVREILPSLIDSLSDAVLVVDRDQRIVAANRRYVEAFAVVSDEIVAEVCHAAVDCPELRSGNGHPAPRARCGSSSSPGAWCEPCRTPAGRFGAGKPR